MTDTTYVYASLEVLYARQYTFIHNLNQTQGTVGSI